MARLSSPGLQASQSPDFNRSSAELGLLLSRLTQNVIHADPEREQRLRTNEYERAKLETVRWVYCGRIWSGILTARRIWSMRGLL